MTPRPRDPAPEFDRPVFIVAAPRSGSTLLFELLARSPSGFTIGDECHRIMEGIAALHPASHGWASNRLTADDATPEVSARLTAGFAAELRDRNGQPPAPGAVVRFLEKTPKNSLRIPFLAAAFPGAHFIHLCREPRGNISSILDAWRSGRFTTYPELPGWPGPAWTMLLIPGWRELIGRPLAEVATRQWCAANDHILADLAALPPERWRAADYGELLSDHRATAGRLCTFAGLAPDESMADPLPLSRATLTPPAPDKWRKNEAEIAPFLPLTEATLRVSARRGNPPCPIA